ncbi:hypothetical protein PI95_029360 [Hassallia byssoidea VB512170]|uniref:Uncharacterized protein n=1 Tax=Hassallia byssoidea VB512170 TaxID=1304833 RepID=A0A846HGL6_9CYAN|nr:hypothetical protein [Hassalia byssoidea]NEU76512.1 hypothetical protein [Hassalia byssoidea VB512170]
MRSQENRAKLQECATCDSYGLIQKERSHYERVNQNRVRDRLIKKR